MKPGYFIVFLLPPGALYCFTQGGMWAWFFAPVLAGIGIAEIAVFVWNRQARRSAQKAFDPVEETK